MWGQVVSNLLSSTALRIIPTRVGTSDTSEKIKGEFEDHPHACGDKSDVPLYYQRYLGSSPRVWGQDLRAFAPCRALRIIPTRVGTSYHGRGYKGSKRDHPHACGDKKQGKTHRKRSGGSSPRVWGQAAIHFITKKPGRIIPTRVGTREDNYYIKELIQDHPHACGDKIVRALRTAEFSGSSPRVWGQAVSFILIFV